MQLSKPQSAHVTKRVTPSAPEPNRPVFFDFRTESTGPRPSARELIRAGARDFFSPYLNHRKVFLISALVCMVIGSIAGYFLSPAYFGERNSMAQRADLVARNSDSNMRGDAGPYVPALRVHRRMTDENLADLTARLKATRLVQHLGRDYLAPLREAQKVLHRELPYETELKRSGLLFSSLTSLDQLKAEADAKALIMEAAGKFRDASVKIEARISGEGGLPAPDANTLVFSADKVMEMIQKFLDATRLCLESSATDLPERLRLATEGCMTSREGLGAVLFGFPEIAVSGEMMLKVRAFRDDLKKLHDYTLHLAGEFPAGSEEATRLTSYAGSEQRRLALLDELITHPSYNYRGLKKVLDDEDVTMAAARK